MNKEYNFDDVPCRLRYCCGTRVMTEYKQHINKDIHSLRSGGSFRSFPFVNANNNHPEDAYILISVSGLGHSLEGLEHIREGNILGGREFEIYKLGKIKFVPLEHIFRRLPIDFNSLLIG